MKAIASTGIVIFALAWPSLAFARMSHLPPNLAIDGEPVITVLPKDAIPSIDRPEFLSVAEADRDMRDEEPVLGVRRGEIARAYSLWQLNHHEIVNDQVGDLPLAITW